MASLLSLRNIVKLTKDGWTLLPYCANRKMKKHPTLCSSHVLLKRRFCLGWYIIQEEASWSRRIELIKVTQWKYIHAKWACLSWSLSTQKIGQGRNADVCSIAYYCTVEWKKGLQREKRRDMILQSSHASNPIHLFSKVETCIFVFFFRFYVASYSNKEMEDQITSTYCTYIRKRKVLPGILAWSLCW